MFTERPIDKMDKKDYLKILACISVFFIFFFIPIAIFKKTEASINNIEVKSGLERIRMLSEVYKIKHGTFKGMEKDADISKIVSTLNYLGRDCHLILDINDFCAKAKLSDFKIKNWCVDNNNYSGEIINNCNYGKGFKCQ